MNNHEINPKSNHDLYRITCNRLNDIKSIVEIGDISSINDLTINHDENDLRSWLVRQLREKSRHRYNVPQEGEIDLKERPDIRIENPNTSPVSIEIKWSENWSLNNLEERLTNQLVGQYLRAPDSNYGIFVLGYIGKDGKKYWQDTKRGLKVTFDELIQHLNGIASNLIDIQKGIYGLKVIGINFW